MKKQLIVLILIVFISGCKKDNNNNPAQAAINTPNSHTLTVKSSHNSGVYISVSEVDVNGNSDGTTTFTRKYNEETQLYLDAPSTYNGKIFKRWNRDNGAYYSTSTSYGIGMSTNHSVVAEYEESSSATTHSITVESAPSSGVSISVSVNDNNGNSNGTTTFTRTYNEGTQLYLTAPSTYNGKTFKRWNRDNGAYYNTSSSYGIGMSSDHSVVAEYEGSSSFTTHTLTVESSPNSGVSISVSIADNNGNSNGTTTFTRTYNEGTQLYLTAPSTYNGKTFKRWNRDNGAYYSNTSSYGIGMSTDHSVIAEYQ